MVAATPQMFSTAAALSAGNFSLEALPVRVEPKAILLCDPTFFTIVDCKNPFMQGQANHCDVELAQQQWQALKLKLESRGRDIYVVPAAAGLEDMVFAANQGLPGITASGEKYVVLANMVHASRRREVPFYATWFKSQGYKLERISADAEQGPRFEGQGDAIWHPNKCLLWGAYGQRSEKSAYESVAALTGVPVLLLKLVNERFYHLDTAFCPLDSETVLVYSAAFAPESLELIKAVFRNVIEISAGDANNFAANALVLGRDVVLQAGSVATVESLRKALFNPVEVETSEFMKSGGSVFCLKMMVY